MCDVTNPRQQVEVIEVDEIERELHVREAELLDLEQAETAALDARGLTTRLMQNDPDFARSRSVSVDCGRRLGSVSRPDISDAHLPADA